MRILTSLLLAALLLASPNFTASASATPASATASISATEWEWCCTSVDPLFQRQPRYYTVLIWEPDWNLYSPGDVVWMRSYISGGTLVTDRWYVYPSSDPGYLVQPAPDLYDGPWYVAWDGYLFYP